MLDFDPRDFDPRDLNNDRRSDVGRGGHAPDDVRAPGPGCRGDCLAGGRAQPSVLRRAGAFSRRAHRVRRHRGAVPRRGPGGHHRSLTKRRRRAAASAPRGAHAEEEPTAGTGRAVPTQTGRQQALHVGGRQRLRDRGQPPVTHRQHRRTQVPRAAFLKQVAKQGAQYPDEVLGAPRAPQCTLMRSTRSHTSRTHRDRRSVPWTPRRPGAGDLNTGLWTASVDAGPGGEGRGVH